MKKTIAILLTALFALTVIACGERNDPTDASSRVKVTASPAPSEKLTEAPTEGPTEAPTDEPTAVPAEKTIPYNREEYDTLLAFFELADENGVKNGEKCFKDYDPSKVDFWGDVPFRDGSSVLEWDDSGNLTHIDIQGIDWVERELVGGFELQGFASLHSIDMQNLLLESISVRDCNELAYFFIRSVGSALFSGDFKSDRFGIASNTHCRYEGGESSAEFNRFTADVTVEGNGMAFISEFTEDWGEFVIYVKAEPAEGHKFLGWYDAEGKLITEKEIIRLTYDSDSDDAYAYLNDPNFTGTARFE